MKIKTFKVPGQITLDWQIVKLLCLYIQLDQNYTLLGGFRLGADFYIFNWNNEGINRNVEVGIELDLLWFTIQIAIIIGEEND